MAHEPGQIPEELARSADVIVTAHTHEPEITRPDRGPLRINPGEATANCAFAEDGSVLYLTADMYLCRIKTNTKGL